jgi:hypothetical protein
MPVTADRGEILHYAGRHSLSPALREGVPALVGPGDRDGRCGWEAFFAAMTSRRLALSVPEPETAEARFVPVR